MKTSDAPATTPLALRDRAMFELAYASGLRAEELVKLDTESVDFDSETVRIEGKGGRTRRALAARARALSGTRSPGSGRLRHRPAVRLKDRAAAGDFGRQAPLAAVVKAGLALGARARRGPSARAAPLVRDPPT